MTTRNVPARLKPRPGFLRCTTGPILAVSIATLFILVLMQAALAQVAVTLTPRSTATPADEQAAETGELEAALTELRKMSPIFNRTIQRIGNRCKVPITIFIEFGDSSVHTHTDHDGGTFVPTWQFPTRDPGQRVLLGGRVIINKTQLAKSRPGFDYTDFLLEVIAHEIWHAYEFCFDDLKYEGLESPARGHGEAVALEINPDARTLGGTAPSAQPPAANQGGKAAPPVQGAGLSPSQSGAATMVEVDTMWTADTLQLRNLREDYRDAADFCDKDEFSQARDEYISTLNGLIDSYSSLLVDASTAVRNELNDIIDELADEREGVLSGEACQPVEYVRICDAYGTGFYYIPGTETCLQIGGRVDFGNYFSPSVETGTLILGVGNEVALDKSDTRLDGHSVGFELGIGFGGWLHKFDFDYGQADGDSSAEEPVGGRSVGITYFGMVPGTTGINLGASGANIESEVSIETFGFGYEGLRKVPLHEKVSIMYGFGASADWFKSDHESEFTTPSFMDIFSETDQSVTEDAFGFGPVIGASLDFGGGFSLYGSLGVKGIYTSAELDSVQRTTCLPCAPDPTFVEIETDEDEDDFTWGSKITVGFDYRPLPRLSFNVEGSASTGPRWEADNPENPDDDPTHLNRQHGTDWRVGAGLSWAFGAPPPPPPPP